MYFGTCLLVIFGGALGTLGRFLMGAATRHLSQSFPWGTLIGVNALGSFIVGFCGGYTTFSTFSLQTFEMIRAGAWEKGIANVLASCLLCVIAVTLGHSAAARYNQHNVAVAQNDYERDA